MSAFIFSCDHPLISYWDFKGKNCITINEKINLILRNFFIFFLKNSSTFSNKISDLGTRSRDKIIDPQEHILASVLGKT